MTTSIANGAIVDANVSSSAAIQISKINVNSNVNFNGNNITNLGGFSGVSGNIIYGTTTVDMGNNNIDTVGTLYCGQIQPVSSNITIGGNISFTGTLGANLNCGNYNLNNVNQINVSQVSVTTISRPSGQITVSNPMLFTDSGTSFSGTAYGYLNSSGSTGTQASGSGLYSIKTHNRILCATEIDCYSSKNIKKIVSSCDDLKTQQEAVDLFKKIPLFKYDYKDKIKNGNGFTYGIIAEFLENIEPTYVKKDFEYVPNIYNESKCVKIDDGKYRLKFDHQININNITSKKVKIFFDGTEKTDYEILNIFDDHIIIKCHFDLLSTCFIYGTYEPCPSVSKLKIFELNCVVCQFLLKQNQELQNKNEELKNRIKIIENMLSNKKIIL